MFLFVDCAALNQTSNSTTANAGPSNNYALEKRLSTNYVMA